MGATPMDPMIDTVNHLSLLYQTRWKMSLGYTSISKVSKGAKIRNRYNQVPHLTQDTNGKVTNSQ